MATISPVQSKKRKAEEPVQESPPKKQKEATEEEGEDWVGSQQKTFTRWVNSYLAERRLSIKNLITDLEDGTALHALLEVISSKPIKVNHNPRLKFQKLENLNYALAFLKEEGIKTVGIGNTDIEKGNKKLILGLIWTIILRYQIQSQGSSAKKELLDWVRSQIPEYDITNFTSDWQSGKPICALAEAVLPGQMNLPADFTDDPIKDANMGFEKAFTNMDIPKLIDAEDMCGEPDELSNMTYVSFFRDYLEKNKLKKEKEAIERTPVPSKCFARGPGVEPGNEPGIETHFVIEAINVGGRRVPVGGNKFPVSIIAIPSGLPITSTTTDNGDGTYLVKYTPTEGGIHLTIGVTFNGQPIQKSPYKVLVSKSKPSAAHSLAYGPGLEGGDDQHPSKFTLEPRSILNTVIPPGGSHPFVLKINGPGGRKLPLDVVGNPDGTFTVTYQPTVPGDHVVMISMRDQPVAKSPYNVVVLPASDANQSVATGPGVSPVLLEANPATFTIHGKDKRGNPIKTGGENFAVAVTGPSGPIPCPITDNGNGTYDAKYEPTGPGNYSISVTIGEKPTKSSPYLVEVKQSANAGKTYIREHNFVINSVDARGVQKNFGGEEFHVEVVGPAGTTKGQVVDRQDGTYVVSYTTPQPGNYHVKIVLRGKPIKGSPFQHIVPRE